MPIHAITTLELNAPIDRVWQVMTELGSYKEWNPFVVDVVGPTRPLQIGDPLTLSVVWADGGKLQSGEKVTQVEPPHDEAGLRRAVLAYCFTGWIPALNLVRSTRVQSLEQKAGGPTVYTSLEEFRGFAAAYVPLQKVQDGFDRHARALKLRVER